MTTPLISVAIPSYKAKFLTQAIQSVLNQTYQNTEIIIVNDKSPEDIEQVVRQFKDERIRYYCNTENLGKDNPANNWNKCLSYAKGEFFSLLCDDDLYEPTFLERMMLLAEKYPNTNVFRARANFIDINGNETNKYASAPEWESWEDYLWHVCHNYRSQTISEWMYRREALLRAGGYAMLPLAWYADYLSIYHFAKQGGIASTSDILVHFRLSGDNISSQDNKNTILKIEAAKQYRAAVAELLKDDPKRDEMLGSLDWLLHLHLKYNLKHAPKKVLLKLLRIRKQYGIHSHTIWSAFFGSLN